MDTTRTNSALRILLFSFIILFLLLIPSSCGSEEKENKCESSSCGSVKEDENKGDENKCENRYCIPEAPDLSKPVVIKDFKPKDVEIYIIIVRGKDPFIAGIQISIHEEYIIEDYQRHVDFLFVIPYEIIEEGKEIKVEEKIEKEIRGLDPSLGGDLYVILDISIYSNKNNDLGGSCNKGTIVFNEIDLDFLGGFVKGEMRDLNCEEVIIKSFKFEGRATRLTD